MRELDSMWSHMSPDRSFGLLLRDLVIKEDIESLHAALTGRVSASLREFSVSTYRGIHATLDSPSACSVTISLAIGKVVSIQQSKTAQTMFGFVPVQPIPNSFLMKLRAPSAARQYLASTVRFSVCTVTLRGDVLWENESAGSE
jgi:hypothetical protein